MKSLYAATHAPHIGVLSKDERDEFLAPYLVDDLGDNPAVYVGTYHKYNNGSIAGAWLDLEKFSDYDEFIEVCKVLHSDEEDPEFMFQDFQGFPECWYCESGLKENFDKIIKYAQLDDDDKKIVEGFVEWSGDYDIERAKNAFCGVFDSEEDFAEQMVNDCYNLESMMGNLSYYFDYSMYARDLFMTDYFYSSEGYVFSIY